MIRRLFSVVAVIVFGCAALISAVMASPASAASLLLPLVDLAIVTNDDFVTQVTAGNTANYTILASNLDVTDAVTPSVDVTFSACASVSWTCTPGNGGVCGSASGIGDIHDATVVLPAGGFVQYSVACTVDSAASGTLDAVATVSDPGSSDPNPANNSLTDSDLIFALTSTALVSDDADNDVLVGAIVKFTATVTAVSTPTGTIQFYENGNFIGSPVTLTPVDLTTSTAEVTTTMLTAGTRAISAGYNSSDPFASSTGNLSIIVRGTPAIAGQLIINEFRLRGANGGADEYVQIYNKSGADLTVATNDGSDGYAVAGGDGSQAFVIPNGIVIPAQGHYLGANGNGYNMYGAAYPDNFFCSCIDILDDAGVALFNTADPASFGAATQLDAVGFTTSNPLYREGTGLTPIADTNGQYAFVRKATTGTPQDTQSNAADFNFVSVDGAMYNSSQSILGAPSPAALLEPREMPGKWDIQLIEPKAGLNSPPNRFRTGTGNSGTLQFRRRIVNHTGMTLGALRLRVMDLTTFNSSGYSTPSQSDLRAASSTSGPLSPPTSIGVSYLWGLSLQSTPTLSIGGGLNSVITAPFNVIFEGSGWPDGSSLDINIVFSISRQGTYRYFLNVEAAPWSGPPS